MNSRDNCGLVLQLRAFGGNQSEHDLLVFNEAQRLESTGTFTVIFQEEAIYMAAAEQRLRHRLIPAGGKPDGMEVAPADVHGNGHILRLGFQRLVDHPL